MSVLLTDIPPLPEKYTVHPSGCWEWQGNRNLGYGRAFVAGKTYRAHRLAYMNAYGPIPSGLVLDHLCRNKACVNPAHLEAVTDRVNVVERGEGVTAQYARQTECHRGHPFDDENTYVSRSGRRHCRACCRLRQRARKGQG